MKPLYLSFQAFGPYVKEQVIDFRVFGENGLFLISGETGSGKTTILDAMTYALYGKSSGNLRGDFSAMRCQLAKRDVNTYVEYIFELRGIQYKFSRTMKYGRKHFSISQSVSRLEEDVFVPFFENPKQSDLEQKAQELLGLKYDQFRQVIMLPQGQFERLLIAKSSEKEEILVSLFGADIWQKAAEILYKNVMEQKRKIDYEDGEIERKLKEYGCSKWEELNELYLQKQVQYQMQKEKEEKIQIRLAQEKEAFEQEMKHYERVKEFKKKKLRLMELEKQKDQILEYEKQVGKSQQVRVIKPLYDQLLQIHKEKGERIKKQEVSQVLLRQKEQALEQVMGQLEVLEQKRPQMEQQKQRFIELGAMKEQYQLLEERKKVHIDSSDTLEKQGIILKEQMARVELISKEKLTLAERESREYTTYSQMLSGYMGNISGMLAKELRSDMPCPVCGSTHHPQPATANETEVTKELLELQSQAMDQIKKQLRETTDYFDRENGRLEQVRQAYLNTKEQAQQAQANLEACQTNLSPEISSVRELQGAMENLEQIITTYEQNIKQIRQTQMLCQSQYDEERTREKILTFESEKTIEAHKTLLQEFDHQLILYGFQDRKEFVNGLLNEEEEANLKKKISGFHIEYQSLLQEVGRQEPQLTSIQEKDVEQLRKNVQHLEQEQLSYNAQLALTKDECKRIKQREEELNTQILENQKQKGKMQKNLLFAAQLRGDSGISLQRYVLGVMLSSITTEANRLLEHVHGGRYRLYRTLEASKGTRKAGLELEVFDHLTGEKRGVVSLSGGEKFLVSLSLSIGLSTVVQAQSGGIALEAMFIDEGFGSLDPSSISDALSVLAKIKQNRGMVGIISHVDSLKETISMKIHVEKKKSGSELSLTF